MFTHHPILTPPLTLDRRTCAMLMMAAAAVLSLNQSARAKDDAANSDRSVPEIQWDTTINKFRYDADKFLGQRLTVKCPPAPLHRKPASIYGSDFYPSESSICEAALHAGMITEKGGLVTIQVNPGLPKYVGSDRNGVVSMDLPGTARSISFVGGPGEKETNSIHLKHIPRIKWDTNFSRTGLAYRNLIGQRFTFRLPAQPNDRKARLVYGTDAYAFASKVGWAALHSGKLSREGGIVSVELNDGVTELMGSIRNGVETKSKKVSDLTISFVKNPVDG